MALEGLTVPAPCALPSTGKGGAVAGSALVLRCAIVGQQVQVASLTSTTAPAVPQQRLHLVATAAAVAPAAAASRKLSPAQRLATMPGLLTKPQALIPIASAPQPSALFATVAVPDAALSSGDAAVAAAQLDAALQLCAAARCALDPALASLLQVPAAAEAFLPSPLARGSGCSGAAVAVMKAGSLSADGMQADCGLMLLGGGGGSGGGASVQQQWRLRGLKAKTVEAGALRAAALASASPAPRGTVQQTGPQVGARVGVCNKGLGFRV